MWNGVHSSSHCDPSRRNVYRISENNLKRCERFECVSKTALFSLISFSVNYLDDWGDYSASFLSLKMTIRLSTLTSVRHSASAWLAGIKYLFWLELCGLRPASKTRNLATNPSKRFPRFWRLYATFLLLEFFQIFSNRQLSTQFSRAVVKTPRDPGSYRPILILE